MSFIKKIIGKSIKYSGLGSLLGLERDRVRQTYTLGSPGGSLYSNTAVSRKQIKASKTRDQNTMKRRARKVAKRPGI